MNELAKRLSRLRKSLARAAERAFGKGGRKSGKAPAASGTRNLFADEGEFRPRRRFASFKQRINRIRSFSSLLPRPVRERPELGGAMALVGVLLLAASVYLLGFSSYFRIAASRVVVERTDTLSDINIAYKSLESAGVYGASIFSLDSGKIRADIMALQPNVEDVEVDRLYPQGLKIILSSSEPVFSTTLPGEKSSYLVTRNGVLVYEKSPDPGLPKFELVNPEFVEAGFYDYRPIADPDTMAKIDETVGLLAKAFPTVRIEKVRYFASERELHIPMESGTILILELGSDAARQVAGLSVLDTAKPGILERGEYAYIDLRVPLKAFLCRERATCMKNLKRIYETVYADA